MWICKGKYFFFHQNICQFMFGKNIYRFHTFQRGESGPKVLNFTLIFFSFWLRTPFWAKSFFWFTIHSGTKKDFYTEEKTKLFNFHTNTVVAESSLYIVINYYLTLVMNRYFVLLNYSFANIGQLSKPGTVSKSACP